jgi:hypothetical protein
MNDRNASKHNNCSVKKSNVEKSKHIPLRCQRDFHFSATNEIAYVRCHNLPFERCH